MRVPSPEVLKTIRKFLIYSFDEISFRYEELTTREQNLCTKEEFEKMIEWLRE